MVKTILYTIYYYEGYERKIEWLSEIVISVETQCESVDKFLQEIYFEYKKTPLLWIAVGFLWGDSGEN